ncbi:MAG: hypothetical protein H7318_17680 [Oligoflexus sp.]|nr:hypothetical protein [Oligoflexus sp.]
MMIRSRPPMQDEIKSIPKGWKAVPLAFFQRPAPIVAAELLTCVLLRKTKTGWIGGGLDSQSNLCLSVNVVHEGFHFAGPK